MADKKQSVTVKSIAEKAGVSISTVSYVLSGKRKISKEVRERILSIMKEMGYKPNVVARNLASKKTWSIGLYAPPVGSLRDDLYFNSILVGILDALHPEMYQLLIYADYLNEEPMDHPDLTTAQPIDGALVMNPRENCVYRNYLLEVGLPHVVIGMPSKSVEKGFYVAHDLEAGITLAVTHLVERGYKKPALVTHRQEYGVFRYLVSAYRKAMDNMGLRGAKERIYSGDVLLETGYKVAKKIFEGEDPADSFIIQNDLVALGVLEYLGEKGIPVPREVGVVSIGDTLLAKIHRPPITTISCNPYLLGKKAAVYLLEVIRKERVRPVLELLPVKLIKRGTT